MLVFEVHDGAGKPVAGAEVQVVPAEVPGVRRYVPSDRAKPLRTDAAGRVRASVASLPVGVVATETAQGSMGGMVVRTPPPAGGLPIRIVTRRGSGRPLTLFDLSPEHAKQARIWIAHRIEGLHVRQEVFPDAEGSWKLPPYAQQGIFMEGEGFARREAVAPGRIAPWDRVGVGGSGHVSFRPLQKLTGRVLDSAGRPVGGAVVLRTDDVGTVSGPDGRFEIDSGTDHLISIRAPGRSSRGFPHEKDDVGDIMLPDGRWVTGTVTDHDGVRGSCGWATLTGRDTADISVPISPDGTFRLGPVAAVAGSDEGIGRLEVRVVALRAGDAVNSRIGGAWVDVQTMTAPVVLSPVLDVRLLDTARKPLKVRRAQVLVRYPALLGEERRMWDVWGEPFSEVRIDPSGDREFGGVTVEVPGYRKFTVDGLTPDAKGVRVEAVLLPTAGK